MITSLLAALLTLAALLALLGLGVMMMGACLAVLACVSASVVRVRRDGCVSPASNEVVGAQ